MGERVKSFFVGLFGWESILQDYVRSLIVTLLGRAVLKLIGGIDVGAIEHEILFWAFVPVMILMFIGFFRKQPLNRGRLIGRIQRIVIGDVEGGEPGIVLVISIVNLGLPSIAEDFLVEIELPDGGTITPEIFVVNGLITLQDEQGGFVRYSGADYIFNKTYNPIVTGGTAVGILTARVVGVTRSRLDSEATVIRVRCLDAWGKECTFSRQLGERQESASGLFTPGLAYQDHGTRAAPPPDPIL